MEAVDLYQTSNLFGTGVLNAGMLFKDYSDIVAELVGGTEMIRLD